MAKETEIKLRASAATLDALRAHPLLKKRCKDGWQRHELSNCYYDTDTRDLAHAKVALRVRRDGDRYIQTLKSRGQSVAGLSERNEWEWPLSDATLDTARFDDSCWPAELADLDLRRLQPVFDTDFVRDAAEIAWGRGKARTIIEVALDQGEVRAGEQREAIIEVELELRQGEPAALLELAEQLAAELPLMPCDISKAERGYRLHDAASYTLYLAAPELDAETPLDEAVVRLGWHLLASSQRLAEQYRWNGHWRLLVDWVHQLIDLRALLGSLGQAAPRTTTRELRQTLDELLADWRPLAVIGQDDEDARRQAPQRFASELEQPRWGLFSLRAARWLQTRGWTQGRTGRGERQGATPLGQWLPRLLAQEAAELPLLRAVTEPELIEQQLPRLERMQVWLHLARGSLDLPEADRLYGELGKLAPLSAHGDLAGVSEQARLIFVLAPWKALT